MVTSTKDNLSRVERNFVLRNKYAEKIKASPSMDLKLWKKIYTTFTGDLSYQIEKVKEILETLKTVDKKAQNVQHEFQQVIGVEGNAIKAVIAKVQKNVETLEAQIKATNCDMFHAESSFTANC